MTQDTPSSNTPPYKTIGIIGGGISGITALYDLSRTLRDGTSLFKHKSVKEEEEQNLTAFDEIVLFERNISVGGVWSLSTSGNNNTDPPLPDFRIIKKDWDQFENIYVKPDFKQDGLEEKLKSSSYEKPVVIEKSKLEPSDLYQWKSSAAYDQLFTNVPNLYMTYSFDDRSEEEFKKLSEKYPKLGLFQTKDDLGEYLERVVKDNDLDKYIRYNSNVERIRKLDSGKWEVATKKQEKKDNGKIIDYWYTQIFDAIILANGKTTPILPVFENLPEFVERNKDKTFVTLAKAVKNTDFIRKAKKLLFVGSNNSAIDLLQYAFPRDLENPSIYISRRSGIAGSEGFAGAFTAMSWSKGIISKPVIKKFIPEENGVLFEDGSSETDFDAIIICTGYHYCYPFFEKEYVEKHPRLTDFYHYTFSVDDQSLALVGNKLAPFFFSRAEAQAAAIAGVFSGVSKLPTSEEKGKWHDEFISQVLSPWNTNEKKIIPLLELAPKGRQNPLLVNKKRDDATSDFARARRVMEDVFFKLRDNEYTVDNILK